MDGADVAESDVVSRTKTGQHAGNVVEEHLYGTPGPAALLAGVESGIGDGAGTADLAHTRAGLV